MNEKLYTMNIMSPNRGSVPSDGWFFGGVPSPRACFKKNSPLHIRPKNFRTTFLGILPQNLQFLAVENSDDLFFSHHLFLRFPSLAHVTQYPAFPAP